MSKRKEIPLGDIPRESGYYGRWHVMPDKSLLRGQGQNAIMFRPHRPEQVFMRIKVTPQDKMTANSAVGFATFMRKTRLGGEALLREQMSDIHSSGLYDEDEEKEILAEYQDDRSRENLDTFSHYPHMTKKVKRWGDQAKRNVYIRNVKQKQLENSRIRTLQRSMFVAGGKLPTM